MTKMANLGVKELTRLKEEIDQAKETVNQLKGQKQALMKQLESYGCKDLKSAQAKIDTMKNEIDVLQDEINKGVTELEENYL